MPQKWALRPSRISEAGGSHRKCPRSAECDWLVGIFDPRQSAKNAPRGVLIFDAHHGGGGQGLFFYAPPIICERRNGKPYRASFSKTLDARRLTHMCVSVDGGFIFLFFFVM